MKVLLKHITELDFLLLTAKSYYLSSSAMSNFYQIVSWNLLKFISTVSEYSNISLVLLLFKLTSWFNSISFGAEINPSSQEPSTAHGENEYRWSSGVLGCSLLPNYRRLHLSQCSRDPVISLAMEWGAALSIWKAVVSVMEFPAEREAFLELGGWQPTTVTLGLPGRRNWFLKDIAPLPASPWLLGSLPVGSREDKRSNVSKRKMFWLWVHPTCPQSQDLEETGPQTPGNT